MTSDRLLAPTFLFRFSVPCGFQHPLWSKRAASLNERYVVPSFGELEGSPRFADVRMAWSDDGLLVVTQVEGKKQPPWCRDSRFEDSDGVHVWIDTRDTHNIHRAGRFCHHFAFLPFGSGRKLDEPCGCLMNINRARENPKPVVSNQLKLRSEHRINGYLLEAFIPAIAITGFDPSEHPRLGFSYAVVDRELGWQTFSVGPEFPFQEDPSLWGTLELVKS